ncbi:AT-rich interactive domain-containing protein 3 [Platanthera guangdongensis]|uniref:AT-rich interactive domain-containing protein 3 n=1 Tax=Platanthera guangdongensis TaxID=2320717 RepID=A0ABR2MFF9_9ASPA
MHGGHRGNSAAICSLSSVIVRIKDAWSVTMSRSAENSEAVLENSGVPEAVKTDVKEESEGFPSLITKTVGEENAQLQTDIVGRTVSEDAAQEIAMDLDMPSTNLNPQADLDHEVITEEVFEIEKDHKEVSNRTLDADLRADKSNNHNGSCFTMKHEGVDGDNHAQAGDFNQSFSFDPIFGAGDDPGTEEEQAAFMKELENFFKERSLEFKPPKFYGEGLNCLKLWRAVTRLGGYEQGPAMELWRRGRDDASGDVESGRRGGRGLRLGHAHVLSAGFRERQMGKAGD